MYRFPSIAQPRAVFAFAADRMSALLPLVLEVSVLVAAASLLGAGYAAALAWDWISELL